MKTPDNMNYWKWISCCLLLSGGSMFARGQSVESMNKAIEMLDKVSKTYKSQELSFDLRYTYANEHQPYVLLDSLNGHMQLAKGNCRYAIGNTILLKNAHYNIAVFKEDKLIHVSGSGLPDSIDTSPMGMIKASILQAGVRECHISRKGDTTLIRFSFLPDKAYKYVEIKLDSKNSRIYQLQYIIRSTLLSESGRVEGEGYEPYALVNAFFTRYKTALTDPAVFDETQFFTHKTDALVPAPAYEDYEIFIGTPNI